jgi:hypothetical protein
MPIHISPHSPRLLFHSLWKLPLAELTTTLDWYNADPEKTKPSWRFAFDIRME